MRSKEEAQATENPTVYRKLQKRLLANCSFCRWHRNENLERRPKRGTRKWNKKRRG